ncbi:MAG: hypothetical protein FJ146_11510 [Deltaproteobacteria bacterium]|nr:hypothetical protein [Deltaproteobacteria bacterium]
MRKLLIILSVAAAGAVSLATMTWGNHADCPVSSLPIAGDYPDHALSPEESLRVFDTVVFGEVVVPSRKCSLGQCAGIRVIKTIKGRPGSNLLLRIAAARDIGTQQCKTPLLAAKGSKWVVFANQGTSRGGQRYFDVSEDGPSFTAEDTPDFTKLETQYRIVRARLDSAIANRMGRVR